MLQCEMAVMISNSYFINLLKKRQALEGCYINYNITRSNDCGHWSHVIEYCITANESMPYCVLKLLMRLHLSWSGVPYEVFILKQVFLCTYIIGRQDERLSYNSITPNIWRKQLTSEFGLSKVMVISAYHHLWERILSSLKKSLNEANEIE